MPVTGYQIVTSTTGVDGLQQQVLELMADNWQPTGGVVVAPDAEWTTVYIQAMVYAPPLEVDIGRGYKIVGDPADFISKGML